MKILMRCSSTIGHEMSLFSHNSRPVHSQGGRCHPQRERWSQLMGQDQGILAPSWRDSFSVDVHCLCSLPTSASNHAAWQTRVRSYQLRCDWFLGTSQDYEGWRNFRTSNATAFKLLNKNPMWSWTTCLLSLPQFLHL